MLRIARSAFGLPSLRRWIRKGHRTRRYSMTEYSTTFSQQEPCYVAVAAINDTETGKVHELFLDWSNERPMPPQDVIVLDKMLDIVDSPYREQPVEDENSALAF